MVRLAIIVALWALTSGRPVLTSDSVDDGTSSFSLGSPPNYCRFSNEAIAYTGYRLDKPGLLSFLTQRPSNLPDGLFHGIFLSLTSPDGNEKLLLRDDGALVLYEKLQNFEGDRREMDAFVSAI